jgi:hypothetical protein
VGRNDRICNRSFCRMLVLYITKNWMIQTEGDLPESIDRLSCCDRLFTRGFDVLTGFKAQVRGQNIGTATINTARITNVSGAPILI